MGGNGPVTIPVASTCRIAAKRLRREAGATGHNARERDTGERRDAGAGMVASMGQHLTDRGQPTMLTGDASPAVDTDATSARERDTGERRDAGQRAAPAGSRRGYAYRRC